MSYFEELISEGNTEIEQKDIFEMCSNTSQFSFEAGKGREAIIRDGGNHMRNHSLKQPR